MIGLLGPALIAAGVLFVAGVAKLAKPTPTAQALQALPWPLSPRLARVAARGLGATEVAAAAFAVGNPTALSWGIVTLMYSVFAVFIISSLAGLTELGSCGCFGSDDTPPTIGHLIFNAVCAAVTALVAMSPLSWAEIDLDMSSLALLVTTSVLGTWISVLSLTALPALFAIVRGASLPVKSFEIDPHLRNRVT